MAGLSRSSAYEHWAYARAWLYQIAHRVALDEFRRRKIVRFIPWTGETHGTAPSAEHLAMDARLSAPLQRALDKIPLQRIVRVEADRIAVGFCTHRPAHTSGRH